MQISDGRGGTMISVNEDQPSSTIRVLVSNRSCQLTPNEARSVAYALLDAADKKGGPAR